MTARLILAVSALALTASACAPSQPQWRPTLATSADRHKPVVTEQIARLDLAPLRGGVSPADRPALAAFLRDYRNAGHGPLVISLPAGEAPDAIAEDVLAVAAGVGMAPPTMMIAASMQDGGSPYHVSFVRYHAHVAECGQVWPSLAQTTRSETWDNFGCAHNANLAAMIADPADLVRPREMTPADAQRRATVLEAYRSGQSTAASGGDTASSTGN